jgi:hypothetical protein
MTWSRFGRYTRVRHAECAAFEYSGTEEGSKRARGLCKVCEELWGIWRGRIGVGIWEGLECLVCAEAVTCAWY